jgi:hypothetical protein
MLVLPSNHKHSGSIRTEEAYVSRVRRFVLRLSGTEMFQVFITPRAGLGWPASR